MGFRCELISNFQISYLVLFYFLFFDDSTRWLLKRNLCGHKEEHKAFPAFHHGSKVMYPLPSSDTQNTLSKQGIDS